MKSDGTESWMAREIEDIHRQGLYREVCEYPGAGGKIEIAGRSYLNFSSNDYLDLANNPEVKAAAEKYLHESGTGSTASRLVTGTLPCHTEMEKCLAAFKGYPAALVFGSGYLTNIGVIPALMGKNDLVLADKLVHASIVDGIILSRAKLQRFRHNDPAHLEELLSRTPAGGKRLVITESVFSMDGDLAPLKELAAVAGRYETMFMVDEAHATGIFGPGGSGLVRELAIESSVNISMGTLSKALGGYGGFVACSKVMRELLVNRARAFIYTTALPPSVIGSSLGALELLRKQPGLGADLLANAALFRADLRAAGLNTGASESQIIPVIVGDSAKALTFSRRLKDNGLLAIAIRPPTVPQGTARLRLSVTLAHSRDDLHKAARIITECARSEAIV